MYVVCAELNSAIWDMLQRPGVDLRAAIVSAYAHTPIDETLNRVAKRIALAHLAGYLSILEDYSASGTALMNTRTWTVPSVVDGAVSWFKKKVEAATAVPVRYDVVKRVIPQAIRTAPAAHLDTAARLVKHVESNRAKGKADDDTRSELKSALLDLGLTPGGSPIVESAPVREALQLGLTGSRNEILSLDFYRAAYPYWKFVAVMDDRTSIGCRHLNGLTMKANDPRWEQGFVPPRHFNCRSQIVAVSHSEGVKAKNRHPEAGYAGEGAFATLKKEWEPKPGNYPDDLWEIYQKSKDIEDPHLVIEGPWWRKKRNADAS